MNLDWSIVWQSRGPLFEGALVTILLTALTMLIAVPGGIVLALMRGSRVKPVALFATGFVELFRNLPLLLVVYWAFYVMPVLTGLGLPPFATGLAALCLNVSAYNSETFRSGINSIRKGQSEAGLALGMSRSEVFRQIVLPQAWRRVLPILASTWVSLFKDTSLVSVIAVGELAHTAMQIRSQSFRVLEMLTAMAAIYWLLGYPQAKTRRLDPSEIRSAGMTAFARKNDDKPPMLVYDNVRKSLWHLHGRRRRLAACQCRRGGLPDRSLRLGQIDAAAMHERPGNNRRRRDPLRRQAAANEGRRYPQDSPADGNGISELRAIPAQDRARERLHRTDHRQEDGRRGSEDARTRPAHQGRARPTRPRTIPRTSPAASSSAWQSPARSPWNRMSCCSTSRPRRSIPKPSARC